MTKLFSPVHEVRIGRVLWTDHASYGVGPLSPKTSATEHQEVFDATLHTKLRRPTVGEDVVLRSHLLSRLDHSLGYPLILLSAPAGYGKTTLLATWLESCDCPSAWLSLDEDDSDLPKFLMYFLAALKSMFVEIGQETLEVLLSEPAPTFSEIINQLVRELDSIDQDFILVLDDYHVITAPKVHDLIHELLRHPPKRMHLVISSRYDPPLPISTMRARNLLVELRIQDLRFTTQETADFIHSSTGVSIEETGIKELTSKTEGWIGGLHLAVLSLGDHGDFDRMLHDLRGNHHYVRDYLIEAVLSHQPPSIRDCLLKSSILRKLNADICDAITSVNGSLPRWFRSIRGEEFIRWLTDSNLFLVPLDDQNEWFRYHRLFQDLLQHQLEQQCTKEQVDKLHTRAGEWFAGHGQVEEALYHFLEADAIEQAVTIVAQQRYRWMNLEDWEICNRLLERFPESAVHSHIDLLMMYTWMMIRKNLVVDLGHLLDEIESHLLDRRKGDKRNEALKGELETLRAKHFQNLGDAGAVQEHARQALRILPGDLHYLRIQARTCLSTALLSEGEVEAARETMAKLGGDEPLGDRNLRIRSMAAQCNMHWAFNETEQVVRLAKGILQLGKGQRLIESIAIARHFLGWIQYFRNELVEAEKNFSTIVKDASPISASLYTHSLWGMALTYHAQGQTHQATEVIERGEAYLLNSGATHLLKNLNLLRADLAVREGQVSQAAQWTSPRDFQPCRESIKSMVYSSRLSMIKIQMALRVEIGRERAAEWLTQLGSEAERMHSGYLLIQVLALQSLLYADRGEEEAALAALKRAVQLAEAHGFLRPFIDLGPKMANLLYQLINRGMNSEYLHNLINTFMEAKPIMSTIRQEELIEPLTERELDVLQLLAMRLINKEIAERLVISPGTVKSHTIRIYRKLDVNGRREAVKRAAVLGIIPAF